MLIDKTNVHNNRLQVINQYEVEGTYKNRYDVTVLVNGLPMVHIELKRRGVDIREAFNQINRYQRDSFWAGSGLFEYVQLFVISNGTLTKYYSNTTRRQHIDEAGGAKKVRKTSNSFDFTSWWADAANKPIQELGGFAKTFFARAHAAEHPHPLLRAHRRPDAAGDAAVPDRRDRADPAAHPNLHQPPPTRHDRRRRLRVAHHRVGQDAHQLQDCAARHQAARRRQGAVRGGPQGPRLPDDARIRPVREGRGQLEHLDPGAEAAVGRPELLGSS